MAGKAGKDFEDLVAVIERSVLERAEVIPNAKLRDVHTGQLRQIDILIRVADGHHTFQMIVEVRDRSRPVGVDFVEQVAKKREAVRADVAVIVSKSGFHETAFRKAEQLAIRALTYEEVAESDWSAWLQARTFTVLTRHREGCHLHIELDPQESDGKTFNRLHAVLGTGKVFSGADRSVSLTKDELINQIVDGFSDSLYEGVKVGDAPVKRRLHVCFDPTVFVQSDDGSHVRVAWAMLSGSFYLEAAAYPLRLMRYKPHGADRSVAEVASCEVEIGGRRYQFDLVAPGVSDAIEKGTRLTVRCRPLGGSSHDVAATTATCDSNSGDD